MKSSFHNSIKRITVILLILAMLLSSTAVFASLEKGDLNADTKLNSKDLSLLQKFVLTGNANFDLALGDLNSDSKINSKDISALQSLVLHGSDFSLGEDPYKTFPLPENSLLQGKLIVLDAGHGIGEGGVYKDFYEHTYNLIYVNLIKESLEASGARVVLTREDDNMVDNYLRMAFLNKTALEFLLEHYQAKLSRYDAENYEEALSLLGDIEELYRMIELMGSILENPQLTETYFLCPYDEVNGRRIHAETEKVFRYLKDDYIQNNMLFISIHTNAPGNPGPLSVNGTVTYYIDNEYNKEYYDEYLVENNRRLSLILLDRVSQAGGFAKKECDTNDFFMLRETTVPSSLVEVGYHTNASDRKKILSDENRKRVANAVAVSVMEYFGKSF